jgi:hypothetical protein
LRTKGLSRWFWKIGGFLVMLYLVGFYVSFFGGATAAAHGWGWLPPIASLLLQVGLLFMGLTWVDFGEPLDGPIRMESDRVVALAESWGTGGWSVLTALGLTLACAIPALAGVPWQAMTVLSAGTLLLAVVGGVDAQLRKRPTELRLDFHALEVWSPRRLSGALVRRHRIPLHEIVTVRAETRPWVSMEINSETYVCMKLRIVDEGARVYRVPLPMNWDSAHTVAGMVERWRDKAREAQADPEALAALEALANRAQEREGDPV